MAADAGLEPELFDAAPVGNHGELIAFRYCSYDVPFWVLPNAGSGRWHLLGDPPTQYWSTTPDGAWAELIRAEDLASERELDLLRMPMWVCRTTATGLLDLRIPANVRKIGLSPEDLVADHWQACQQAARKVRAAGHRGVIAASAALPGAVNITFFGPRRAIALDTQARLASAVPSAIVAIGRPREGLIDSVDRRPGHRDPTLF